MLIGHGTRQSAGREEFLEAVELVRRRLPQKNIEPAFLELCEPDIPTAMSRLVSAGATRIVAHPVLLFAAGHARRDIPEALAVAASQHPHVEVRQAPHLGCHPALIELSKQRFLEAFAECDVQAPGSAETPAGVPAPSRRVGWLMVGRGSSDASALAEMQAFVDLRLRQTPVFRAETCFLAVAQPRLEEAIERMAESDATHVVVQPHLLFFGELMAHVRAAVEAAQRRGDKVWRAADHLGPAPQLVEAICGRCAEGG